MPNECATANGGPSGSARLSRRRSSARQPPLISRETGNLCVTVEAPGADLAEDASFVLMRRPPTLARNLR